MGSGANTSARQVVTLEAACRADFGCQRGGILKAYTANNDKAKATVKANAYLIAREKLYGLDTVRLPSSFLVSAASRFWPFEI